LKTVRNSSFVVLVGGFRLVPPKWPQKPFASIVSLKWMWKMAQLRPKGLSLETVVERELARDIAVVLDMIVILYNRAQ